MDPDKAGSALDDIDKGINDGKNAINDHFAKPCTTDDNCDFFQKCEIEKGATIGDCSIRTWAWVVLIVGIVAVVFGMIGCVCCCVKKCCCCGGN